MSWRLRILLCAALMSPFFLNISAAYAAECVVTKSSYVGNGTNGTNGVPYVVNTISQTGSCTWPVPTGVTSADVLGVGGGGGGAGGYNPGSPDVSGGGGGGAGGSFQAASYPLTPGNSISITVGAGGTGGASSSSASARDSTQGGQGLSTTFGSVTGGGGGAGGYTSSNLQNGLPGTAGGGGGGATYHWNAYNAGTGGTGSSVTVGGTTFTGVNGGAGSIYVSGSGNAGAGGGRTSATSASNATPGSGIDSYYTGTLTTYGRGGIGYGSTGWSAGLSAQGIGYGGNGGQYATGGTAGGDGLIVVRYAGVNINSFSLSPSNISAVYRTASTISVSVSAPATITFYANGKKITKCSRIPNSGTSPNFISTCTWKPATHGTVSLTASGTSNTGGYSFAPTPLRIPVSVRPGNR